ncbi:hypothetical protein LSCM4_02098 [Leishmania orientalis]|uniref:J domain-containing protein n=1 Tax=Leishmania orientalis TaxID=2249476 RepID=A0A836KJB9_9TRYP|nr:hypothetical protein LSCM4_02098 [Leishmania orientalis]
MTSSSNPRGTGAASADSASKGGAEPSPSGVRSNTLYTVLNVCQSATTEEITAAYRKLALLYHPDRPNGSQVKFQEVQRAYEVLNAKETRAAYDSLLRGKLDLRKFKRPPPLESVLQPVYTLLADGAFYEFEAASSKLKCSLHYGDGIQFNGELGSFIGLAGDGFMYWTVSGRGFASRLCKFDSSFALSSIRIMYRSNMGLRKTPLKRSFVKSSSTSGTTGPLGGRRTSSGSAGGTGRSASRRGTSNGSAANMSLASRIKEALLNRERSRDIKRRLETTVQEETEERGGMQQDLWRQFSSLHTTAATTLQSLLQETTVPVGMGLCMDSLFAQVPLCSSDMHDPQSQVDPASLQAASWADPPQTHCTDNEILRQSDHDSEEENTRCTARGADVTGRCKPGSGQNSSTSSPSLRCIPTSEVAADEGFCRGCAAEAPPTLLPTAPHFRNGAAAVTEAHSVTGAADAAAAEPPLPSASPPPLFPKPKELQGDDTQQHPTSESYSFSTFPPSHAADGAISESAAEEVVPGRSFERIRTYSSGPCTRADWGEFASFSLGVPSSVTEKTAEAVVRGKEGFAICGSAAALPVQQVHLGCERSLDASSEAAAVSAPVDPHGVSLTETAAGKPREDCKACTQLRSRSSNGSSVGVAMLPVRAASALRKNPELDAKGGYAVLRRGKHLPKKSNTRGLPRYMSATEAYARRKSSLLTDSFKATTQGTSSLYEASRPYSGLTADQFFEEERLFMESFSKTMRNF